VKALMTKFNLQLQNISGFSTDGAPAMVGSKAGVTSLIKKELASNNVDMHDFTAFHCIIHQQNLCAKSVKCDHVMKKVVSTINFIKSRALNHRQFQQFLEDVEAECGDLIYYCEVRWLSKGKMLKRFYDLRDEIATFMDTKGKIIPELSDDNWLISMNKEFGHRFQDFRSQESSLHMFSSPFDVNVEQAPEEFQMELIELQGNDDLKRDMKDYSLLEFYKRLPEESFPKIKDLARKKMSLFGSTYICEQLFTKMKHTKSKTRSRLTDCHLENSLRVAA
uniref:HAT C-terminal dimerisation domain-containing protein n=1 Tax=Ciona savignyi TaxID=51511 RepID=H2YR08_CIOSA